MSGTDVLLVQFLAHLLGDFYFQSERSYSQKEHKDGVARSGALWANVRHVLVVWIFSALGFLAVGLMQSGNSRYYGLAFQASIVLAILHLTLDLIILLLVKGLYTEAGLVLGAKSILRYESTGRNEYVLVGTLLSVMVVVTVYVLLELAGFTAF